MKTRITYFIVLFILAAFMRFVYLDRIPSGIVGDELDYIFSTKLYALTGSDVTGTWTPWSMKTVPNEVPKAEFPYLLTLPIAAWLPFSLFNARIIYALINIALVFVIYGITKDLFGDRIGKIGGLIAAVNPWMVYYGRTAFDVPVAVFFFLFAFLVLLRTKGWWLLTASVPLLLGFYSYIGMKILFLPYSLGVFWWVYRYRPERVSKKPLLVLAVFSVFVFSYYAISVRALGTGERLTQVLTPVNPEISAIVDTERRLSVPTPFRSIFSNKLTTYFRVSIDKFFGAYDPKLLFANGEGVATFAMWFHGIFYPFEALFFLIGLFMLYRKKLPVAVLMTAMMLLGPIPSFVSNAGTTYVHRASVMFPFMLMTMAYGIDAGIGHFRKTVDRRRFIVGLGFLYAVAVSNFLYLYLFRFPVYNPESFAFSYRLYSKYLSLANEKKISVTLIDTNPTHHMRNFVFYGYPATTVSLTEFKSKVQRRELTLGTVTFRDTCPSKPDPASVYIIAQDNPCRKTIFPKSSFDVIPIIADGGILYGVYNDLLCGDYRLNPYPPAPRMDDLVVESLTEQRFCETYIIRYEGTDTTE